MAFPNSNGVAIISSKELEEEFKVYKLRWGVLLTIVMLNASCGAIWINNFPVATTVAEYYGRDTKDVNWFSSMFFIGAIPFTFLASYIANKFGLKIMLHIGSALNLVNAVIRALATSGLFKNRNTQFFIGLFGQCFGAIANSFFLGIAPKVSQKWFPDSQRGLSTTFGAMARPLGVIITQLSVPAIVKGEEDIPLNNYIWLGPCILSQVFTVLFITREDPKTPPSRSALPGNREGKPPFLSQIRDTFSSLAFNLLFLTVGGGIGIVFMFGTLTQQMLCPLGYSETFSGIANGLILLGGFVGSAAITAYMRKNQNHIAIMKLAFGMAIIFLVLMIEMFRVPDRQVLLAFFSAIFGFFSMGLLPVALEIGVETTYPAEQTISGTFIYMSGQTQAMIFIILIPAIAKETDNYSMSTCGSGVPYDYTIPLLIVTTVIAVSAILLIYFFDTEYKRRNAEAKSLQLSNSNNITITKF